MRMAWSPHSRSSTSSGRRTRLSPVQRREKLVDEPSGLVDEHLDRLMRHRVAPAGHLDLDVVTLLRSAIVEGTERAAAYQLTQRAELRQVESRTLRHR